MIVCRSVPAPSFACLHYKLIETAVVSNVRWINKYAPHVYGCPDSDHCCLMPKVVALLEIRNTGGALRVLQFYLFLKSQLFRDYLHLFDT